MTWAVVACMLHPLLVTPAERALNRLAPAVLLLGPGQILAVCALPLLYTRSTAAAVAEGMRIYCSLRTGVTYILAVLASHLASALLISRLYARLLYLESKHNYSDSV